MSSSKEQFQACVEDDGNLLKLKKQAQSRDLNPQDTEDAVQDALLATLERLNSERLKFTHQSPMGYIRISLKNHITDRRRHQKVHERKLGYQIPVDGDNDYGSITSSIDTHGVEKLITDMEDKERLVSAVNQLPETSRQAIIGSFFLEESQEETARKAGKTRGAIKAGWQRGIVKLRKILLTEESG